jgi:NADPH:quinone reductase-like Zn-dependent oxidoreductase
MVAAVSAGPGDTVVVSGAAGGVGSIAVQLARRTGASVIGIASSANHAWLRVHGVIPVPYGDGVADRIRAAAETTPSGKPDAFIDTFGADYVPMALDLGIAPSRVDTIVYQEGIERFGVKMDGNMAGARASVLAELAGLIAAGDLEVPIAATFPLDQVQDAYRRLAEGHLLGKIVLIPGTGLGRRRLWPNQGTSWQISRATRPRPRRISPRRRSRATGASASPTWLTS